MAMIYGAKCRSEVGEREARDALKAHPQQPQQKVPHHLRKVPHHRQKELLHQRKELHLRKERHRLQRVHPPKEHLRLKVLRPPPLLLKAHLRKEHLQRK
ncbi:hypothetical protein DMN91_004320, partial [Ooceraea biroi]